MQSPERLRTTPALRAMLRETHLEASQLILPIFLNTEKKGKKAIPSMPDVHQWSVDDSLKFVEQQVKNGIKSFILFGVIPASQKNERGDKAYDPKGPVIQALQRYRKEFGHDVNLVGDACFCEYTDHGHCGVFDKKDELWLRNSIETHKHLAKEAVAYAEAGANIIAPSGMLDNMVETIRGSLDAKGFDRVSVLSYAVKYASAFYGPFRDAAENSPQKGTDRKAYQMNPANRKEAITEAMIDVDQGADMLMVKPALPYLDVIRDLSEAFTQPVGAYHVSGEYSMVKAAAKAGWINEDQVFAESLLSIRRAGAQFILTYWAPRAAELIKEGAL